MLILLFLAHILIEDKSSAAESFEAVRSLWEAKDILIVEGTSSRSGVGNTLFQNAKSISRIIDSQLSEHLSKIQ